MIKLFEANYFLGTPKYFLLRPFVSCCLICFGAPLSPLTKRKNFAAPGISHLNKEGERKTKHKTHQISTSSKITMSKPHTRYFWRQPPRIQGPRQNLSSAWKNLRERIRRYSKLPHETAFPRNEEDTTSSSHTAPTRLSTAAPQQAPRKDRKQLPLTYARLQCMAANGLTTRANQKG